MIDINGTKGAGGGALIRTAVVLAFIFEYSYSYY
jgi:RNA 3'-terminal phosphate cyclase